MNIDEFVGLVPLQVAAFREAYMTQAAVDETFYQSRTESDWWREIAAYMQYIELEEEFRRNEA